MTIKNIFKASLFHSIHYGKIEFLKDAIITVLENGIINEVIRNNDPNYAEKLTEYSSHQNFYDFGDKILLPGFIDLHIHAPQWPQAGLALDDELSCWLDNFTFPL